MAADLSDRRRHTRYTLPSFYTSVDVRRAGEEAFTMSGHAYDISVGGMRFELDDPLEPGTRLVIKIDLPTGLTEDACEAWSVFVSATVVWVEPDDLETHGPTRMACVFNGFALEKDRERLEHQLQRGRYRLAA